jgi:urea carboxylase
MFRKLLIANRGEIACRIIRTLRRMGVASVAVYSEADVHSAHVRDADEAICIGPAQVAQSYLQSERILDAAAQSGAEAIHPGYGFLSESAEFAAACNARALRFVGPTPEQIKRFGLKHEARALAQQLGVPLLPGSELLPGLSEAEHVAEGIGYPVMLKSTAGGGGIGLRVCHDLASLREGFEAVARLSRSNFKHAGVFVEKFLPTARHIEVQIFGDGRGGVLTLGERDCSAQRRNQKVIEETPAPGLRPETRRALAQQAERLGRAVAYASAGTVEFVLDAQTEQFYFLEVNTRLQVEHGVTEAVTGIDLVEWMILQAAGTWQLPALAPTPRGAAIEVRVYAEDPAKQFQPSTGLLTRVALPSQARCDSWIETGTEVTPHYDPLLAKIIVHADDRAAALVQLRAALADTRLDGLETNLSYLRAIAEEPSFVEGRLTTRSLEALRYTPRSFDVVDGGTQTTVQDYPGRQGHWAVGVPPSGPMDDYAFRCANRLVGNDEGEAALELTLTGPRLVCNARTHVAITGADMRASLDGQPVPMWRAFEVQAGQTLALGAVHGGGVRAYLAVQGGFDIPEYLGSRATFMLGRFGGHAGRALRSGDVLHLRARQIDAELHAPEPLELEAPVYTSRWEIGVLYGPHAAPDFFTVQDIETLLGTDFEVHYNSDRTGVRLIGPRPQWARKDGGDAGLHPSNIHDNAYAIGALDFTGDMPVILGPDGPSLGGFVCPVTIATSERWKMGQLKAGDRVRFLLLKAAEAEHAREERRARPVRAAALPPLAARRALNVGALADVLSQQVARADRPAVTYRRAGDAYLLVEYGPLELDLGLRFRVHVLMQALEERALPGIVDLTPGIRSLQIHYAPHVLSEQRLLDALAELEAQLPNSDDIEVPTRIVHLPLSYEDPSTLLAIEKYMRSVRKEAPWCPSNIEFIRRINGLSHVDDVRRIVFDASYLVLGLGDVYLGAPVATPLDPRHRLVTTKYNPARTWTPENAVGIGGAYLCVYGMEGPGGYQFVGRTLQMWNTYRVTREFPHGRPYLLRFFDQLRFFPVAADELQRIRAHFLEGKYPLRIEPQTFSYRDYRAFLAQHAESIADFGRTQRAAFVAERERWAAAGQDLVQASEPPALQQDEAQLPAGVSAIASPVAGSLWKVLVDVGQHVEMGAPVLIVEAMKTEITVRAQVSGRVQALRIAEGEPVVPGKPLVLLAT